jgi:heme-degrading monooxygenase HmoA
MFARVVTVQIKPETVEESTRIYEESIVAAMKEQPGFQGTTLLTKPDGSGTAVSISLWATEADMQAGEASGYLQAQFAKVGPFLTAAPVSEHYEVSVQA